MFPKTLDDLARSSSLTLPSVVAFSPLDLANLLAWYKADGTLWQDSARTTPVASDANPIGAWDDESGNGNHAIQATGAKRPTYKTGIINGRPTVRGDGIDDLLSFTVPQSEPQHVYAVVDTTNVGTGYRIALTSSGGPGVYFGATAKDRKPLVYSGADKATWTTAIARAAIIRWRLAVSDSGVRVDDSAEETAAMTAASGNWTEIFGGVVQPSAVDYAEIVVANAITAAEDALLMAYLNAKWAVY